MEQSCYYEQSIKYNFCSSWILEYILHLHCYFFVIKDFQTLDNFLIKTRQRLEWITDWCIPGSLSWAEQQLLTWPMGLMSWSFVDILWCLHQCELLEAVITYLPIIFIRQTGKSTQVLRHSYKKLKMWFHVFSYLFLSCRISFKRMRA